jgi:asparagine synthase (glutamine-hydrolysing)
MCGIGGIVNFSNRQISGEEVAAITHSLKHRGPDSDRSFIKDTVALVHTRLSIIDLSEQASQPFTDDTGTIVSITNGELYNFAPLRNQLIAQGKSFRSHSDCEIIPFLYAQKGIDFIHDIRGMFAIAIWDDRLQKLFLVRDRFGIKPLYYHYENNQLLFGSELKSILVHNSVTRTVDWQAIHDFLSLCYIPEPATGFKNIYALEPGHYLEVSKEGIKNVCYWDVSAIDNKPVEYATAKQETDTLLTASVRSQLVSDAPLGAFLSGGIDSSTIVGRISGSTTGKPVDTFTVKFPDQAFDESGTAQQIASVFHTNHHTFELEEGKGDAELVHKILYHFDQPFGDSSAIPTFLISQKIRRHVKVALSGDGGDEVFAGYLLFGYYKTIRKVRMIPSPIRKGMRFLAGIFSRVFPDRVRQVRKLLSLADLNNHELICALQSYLNEKNKDNLYSPWMKARIAGEQIKPTAEQFKKMWSNTGDDALKISKVLFKSSLPSDMFKKVDMMSMLAAIEVRVPLLDEKLVEYALALPEAFKWKNNKGKILLRDLLSATLPEEITSRKKTGFAIPLDRLLNDEFERMIREHLLSEKSLVMKICNPEVLTQWVNAFVGTNNLKEHISREGLYQRIFMLLSLEIWYRKYQPNL